MSAPSLSPIRRLAKELFLGAVVALLLSYSTMARGVSVPNERSRVYLAVAMVDHGTFAIDRPLGRFGIILDIARHRGHVYSDKAPGSSFLAAGLYGAVRLFSQAKDWPIDELILLMRRGLMVPLGVLGFFVLRRTLRLTGVTRPLVDLVSLGWIAGSSAFHYSSAFYGHQLVAVAAVFTLWLALSSEARRGFGGVLRAALAGVAMGAAGLTEYQAGVFSILFALYLLTGPSGRLWRVLGYVLGGLPFLLVLGWYNSRCFGGPLELSYHHLANPDLANIHGRGIGGITLPNGVSFFGGMLSLHRGLFTTTPMFLFALPGVLLLWRRARRRLAILLGLIALYFGLFISSSNMWVAGWGFGPRLLVPAMPFFAVLAAHGAQGLHRFGILDALFRGSVVTGILYHQGVHAFFPEPPDDARNPLLDVVAGLYRAKLVAPNLLSAEHPGLISLLPLGLVVIFVAVWILIRRIRPRSWLGRLGVPLASLSVLGLLGLYVGLTGPSWSAKKRRDFTHYVRHLDGTPRPTR